MLQACTQHIKTSISLRPSQKIGTQAISLPQRPEDIPRPHLLPFGLLQLSVYWYFLVLFVFFVQNAVTMLLKNNPEERPYHACLSLSPLSACEVQSWIYSSHVCLQSPQWYGPLPHHALLTPYSTLRSLRSADLGLLAVPRSTFDLRGDPAFAVSAPKLLNSIPQVQNLLLFINV